MYNRHVSFKFLAFLPWIALLLFAATSNGQVQNVWSYGFLNGGQVSALAEESSAGTVVYASVPAGVYKTSDSGLHWALLKNSPPQTSLLAWDLSAQALYASNTANTWKSADHGATWTTVFTAPYSPPTSYPEGITGLAASANNVYIGYRGTVNGQGPLFVSSNAGKTWTSVSPLLFATTGNGHAASIFDLKVDPFQSGVVYIDAGTHTVTSGVLSYTLCVFVAADCEVYASYGGVTNGWTQLHFVYGDAGTIYPERDAQGVLWDYKASAINKYSCANGTCAWAAENDSPQGGIRSFIADGCLDFLMLAGLDGNGVAEKAYGSSADWKYSNQQDGLGNNQTALSVGSMALHCGSGVFAALPAGIWLSGGITDSWAERDAGLTAVNVTTLAMAPNSTRTLYAGTFSNGIYKSADQGKTWTAASNGLKFLLAGDISPEPLSATAIAVHRINPNIVLAGTNKGLFRSTDAGASWTRVASFDKVATDGQIVAGLAADPVTPAIFYAVVNRGQDIAVSKDAGLTWDKFPVGPNAWVPSGTEIFSLTPLALSPTVYPMFFATQGAVMVLNSASGTWKGTTAGPATSVALDPRNPKIVYAGGWGLWKSTDAGVTWTKLASAPAETIHSVTVDSSSAVYLATDAGAPASPDGKTYTPKPSGVWSSTDGGITWTNLKLPPGVAANAVLHDTASGNVIAGTDSMGIALFAKPITLVLSVTPPSLTFSAETDGASPAAQDLAIANTGVGSVTWTATKKQSWLSLGQSTSTLASGTSIKVPVQINSSGLARGQYTDTVTVSAAGAGNSPFPIGVVVNVAGAANIAKLTTSAAVALIGTPVTFTATISGVASKTPTGSVTFNDGKNVLGTAPLAAAKATLTVATLAAGVHSITAAYSGDSYYAPSVSAVLTETVNAPVLSVAPMSFSFSARTDGASPAAQILVIANSGTGSLTWTAGKKQTWLALGQTTSTLTAGASIKVPVQVNPNGLARGQYADSITVTAPGAGHSPVSAAVALSVAGAANTVKLTTSAAVVAKGTPVTLTATVSGVAGKSPAGSITFYDGKNTLGTVTLAAATAKLSTSFTAGVHSITASYSGDSYYAPGVSPALTETANGLPQPTSSASPPKAR